MGHQFLLGIPPEFESSGSLFCVTIQLCVIICMLLESRARGNTGTQTPVHKDFPDVLFAIVLHKGKRQLC